ncbi:hypothetical protein GOBAR_AA27461 [Gossypium barbadense]|uniref:Uncharacterized protein n=1 Tax=Gossypium barbadense TaxID=3634 RepID=A0A2P5WQ61_GOSBA|nr:hypothetical protein GOBAR_AA27461 [Gossypium barbadense]
MEILRKIGKEIGPLLRTDSHTIAGERGRYDAIKISTISIPNGPSNPNSSADCSTANALLVEVELAILSFCMVNGVHYLCLSFRHLLDRENKVLFYKMELFQIPNGMMDTVDHFNHQ